MKFIKFSVKQAFILFLPIIAFAQSNYDAATMDLANFPKLNPNPNRLIKLKVIVPATINIELREQFISRSYEVDKNGDFINQLSTCPITLTGDRSARAGQSKQRPIQLQKENAGFSGVIAIDRLATEKCHWGLQGIVSKSPSYGYGIVAMYLEQDLTKTYPHSADQLVHVWCGLDPADLKKSRAVCSSLDYFLNYPNAVATAVAKANPDIKQSLPAPFFAIDPTTKSLTIVYHDLVAENAASQLGK